MGKQVIIAVVNREKDLGIAINRHWYRIPVRYAPKRKADFLALYQTQTFNGSGKLINFYAPIKKYSFAFRRNLLPEEKDNPRINHLYQKLVLGPIRKTPKKIRNKIGIRVNFGFTTLEKLLHAKEIGQLFNLAPLEQIISGEMQKNNIKAARQYCIMKNGHCKYRLDFAIFCKKGRIDIECDNEKWHYKPRRIIKDKRRNLWLEKHGWRIIRFPGNQITTNPHNCIRKIKQAIHSLGGLN